MRLPCILAAFLITPVRAGEFDKAIEAVLPRVVKLYGVGVGPQAGYGSGVLISKDGLVVTVFSLLIDANRLRGVLSDGTSYDAEVLARDPDRQLALLQLKNPDGSTAGPFPHFDFRCRTAAGDADDSPAPDCERLLRPGDWILAAGNAFKVAEGAEPNSLTHGVFSTRTRLDARRRVKEFPYRGDVLVIDAITSNPGAPGGAVVNLDGEFVGLIGREIVSNLTHTHFNYAMPRDVVYEFVTEAQRPPGAGKDASMGRLDELVGSEKPKPADAGIRLTRTGYKRLPPMVERVQWGSPAEKAGVRKDDVILSINGRSVPDVEAYDDRMTFVRADEPIDLVIQRGGRIISVRIEAGKAEQ
jgi:serine protease Do